MDEAFARFWGQVLLHSVHSIPCYQSLCLSQASDSRTTCLPRSRHKSKTDNKSPCVLKNSFFGAERWGWKFSGAARTHRQAGEKKKEHVFVLLLFPLCVRIPIRHGAAVKYCVRTSVSGLAPLPNRDELDSGGSPTHEEMKHIIQYGQN